MIYWSNGGHLQSQCIVNGEDHVINHHFQLAIIGKGRGGGGSRVKKGVDQISHNFSISEKI